MAVYRFKVAFEDNEDVYREIDIKSSQHFEDFHNVIIQSIGFDNLHDASFYISDDYWHKGEEIILRPEKEDKESKRKETSSLKKQMNKCKLLSLIDDPHQKFVYVYDLKTGWTFLVELMKIVPDDEKSSYPKCIKSVGEAPKQYKTNIIAPVVDEDDLDDDDDDKGKLIDAIAYTSVAGEEDTALLEGEEGEEEIAIEDEEDELSNEFEEEEPGKENFEED